jgi:membrane fusion protein (multidrug efflux system)
MRRGIIDGRTGRVHACARGRTYCGVIIVGSTQRTTRPAFGLQARSVLLALGVIVTLGLCGCSRRSETVGASALPVAVVKTAVAEAKPLLAVEEVVGTVRSKTRAVIEARVGGRIELLAASPGQLMKPGDVIAQLDVREIQARLDQAKVTLEQANRDLERYTVLLQQNVLTKAEFDTAEARQRIAKAAVTETETMLGYAKVTAPFAGVITRKLADVGDIAAPGRGIVELEDPVALRVEANVPEGLVRLIKLGDRLGVSSVELSTPVSAAASEIAPASDPASRTSLVKLDLPPNSGLRLGQFVRVAVPVGEKNSLRLVASAVVLRGQMEMVFVVTNQTAQMRLVKSGRSMDGEVEIVSGLGAGERVVVEGAQTLLDGQPLQEQP